MRAETELESPRVISQWWNEITCKKKKKPIWLIWLFFLFPRVQNTGTHSHTHTIQYTLVSESSVPSVLSFQIQGLHPYWITLIRHKRGKRKRDGKTGSVGERGKQRVKSEGLLEKDETLTRISLLKSVKICTLKVLWNVQAFSARYSLAHAQTNANGKYWLCSVCTCNCYP